MRAIDFFATHPVFTHAEFVASRTGRGRSPQTAHNLLAHYVATGRLLRVRRGLYATVPPGVAPAQTAIDPYLLAGKLSPDAALAYHAALQFHGKSYSIWHRFPYLTAEHLRPFAFRGQEFLPVLVPSTLRSLPAWGGGIASLSYGGGELRVTTLERTLVDLLDRPDLGGGWEEIFRSLEEIEFFDLDAAIGYALARASALTVARLGFFLETHREPLMVEEVHLEALAAHAPKEPRYLDSRRESGRFLSRWNLVVPERVLSRLWEEVG